MKKRKFTIARRLITFTVTRLHANPVFLADLSAAKSEVEGIRSK